MIEGMLHVQVQQAAVYHSRLRLRLGLDGLLASSIQCQIDCLQRCCTAGLAATKTQDKSYSQQQCHGMTGSLRQAARILGSFLERDF